MEKNKIAIVVPCYNESKTILSVYNKSKKFGNVLIIDDCSKDDTRKILNKNQIFYIKNKENIGYERTIIRAFKYILKNWKNTKYILTLDADNELPPKSIPRMHKKILASKADIIIGNRNKFNRFSEKFSSNIFNFFFNISDPLSGLKIYKKKIIRNYINNISKNLFLVDLLILSKNENKKIQEINIKVNKRKDTSRVGSNILINLKILKIGFLSLIFKKT